MKRQPITNEHILAAAIDGLAGAAIVVDGAREIVHITPMAAALLADRSLSDPRVVLALDAQMASTVALDDAILRVTPIVRAGIAVGSLLAVSPRIGEDDMPVLFHGMWTRDPAMKRAFHIIGRAAARDVGILVRGPTGSGKELVARAIHALSPRAAGPFRAVNCAALPATLLESELFGHVKGAFTGATHDHQGIFRTAHRGTLFLDEVAEMPLELQAKLLRVLETRTVIPLGAAEPVEVDARIVAATHQPLRRAVAEGRFRADLMYRLRIVPVFLPALALRHGDVELIASKLIERMNTQGGRQIARIAPSALAAMTEYAWPGNVRELRSALEYAYVIGDGSTLVESDLPPEVAGDESAPPPVTAIEGSEVERIREALARGGGNRVRTAELLGISRATLWRRMRAHGLLTPDELATTE